MNLSMSLKEFENAKRKAIQDVLDEFTEVQEKKGENYLVPKAKMGIPEAELQKKVSEVAKKV